MKATFLYVQLLILTILIACTYEPVKKSIKQPTKSFLRQLTSEKSDTSYMYTGFYDLAEDENDFVKMRLENTNKFYKISRHPFASVIDVKKSELTTSRLDQGDYTELCLTFNDKGTKDIEEGTGNSLVPAGSLVDLSVHQNQSQYL